MPFFARTSRSHMSTIEGAMNLSVMPRTAREGVRIPALYDAFLIPRIRLRQKPFACMPSIAGGERTWTIRRTRAISSRQEQHWQGQSFVMGQLQLYSRGQEKERCHTHIGTTRRRKLGKDFTLFLFPRCNDMDLTALRL